VSTIRLLRAAERAGAGRFVFFSALGASLVSRARFFRAKAVAERAVLAAELDARVVAPSIVYAPGDAWLTLLRRFMHLPWMPVSGSGSARFQPIWAQDAAASAQALVTGSEGDSRHRFELAGPEILTYDEIVSLVMEAAGRRRPMVHLPLGAVRRGLRAFERIAGPSVFATWEEAQLMEESMVTPHGTRDARELGVEPKPMRAVLGLE
jgi:uncharacterized protein YbjT (DUF2867 family)